MKAPLDTLISINTKILSHLITPHKQLTQGLKWEIPIKSKMTINHYSDLNCKIHKNNLETHSIIKHLKKNNLMKFNPQSSGPLSKRSRVTNHPKGLKLLSTKTFKIAMIEWLLLRTFPWLKELRLLKSYKALIRKKLSISLL